MTLRIVVPPHLQQLLQPEIVSLTRLGTNHDGGYLGASALFQRQVSVVSLGMKDDWSFEQAVAKLSPDAVVHSYDPTVNVRTLSKSLWIGVKSLVGFRDLTLWGRVKVTVSYCAFFRNSRHMHFKEWVKSTNAPNDATSMSEILRRIGGERRVLLKIDIEGDEFGVLQDFLDCETSNIADGIFVEFHDLDKRWDEFVTLQQRLLEDFHLIHLHANNFNKRLTKDGIPSVLELSFVRRGIVHPVGRRVRLPLTNLDSSNDASREDYEIIFEHSAEVS